MKVRPSVKPMCEKCKIIKRKGRVTAVDLLHRLGLMPDVSRFLFGPGGRWEVK